MNFPPKILREQCACRGQTHLFFPPAGENYYSRRRELREQQALAFCALCPVLYTCREWARENNECGVWGGESRGETRSRKRPEAKVV